MSSALRRRLCFWLLQFMADFQFVCLATILPRTTRSAVTLTKWKVRLAVPLDVTEASFLRNADKYAIENRVTSRENLMWSFLCSCVCCSCYPYLLLLFSSYCCCCCLPCHWHLLRTFVAIDFLCVFEVVQLAALISRQRFFFTSCLARRYSIFWQLLNHFLPLFFLAHSDYHVRVCVCAWHTFWYINVVAAAVK